MISKSDERTIERMFLRLYRALDPYRRCSDNYAEQLYQMERKAEKAHRGTFNRDRYAGAASVPTCARFFACKHLLEYLLEPVDSIKVTDILDSRPAMLLAAAVVARYRNTIAAEVSEAEARGFLSSFDYVEMVKGREEG